MGDGSTSPEGFDSNVFYERRSNSLTATVRRKGAAAALKLGNRFGDRPDPNQIPSSNREDVFDENSFTELDHSNPVEPGTPIKYRGEIGVIQKQSTDGEIEVMMPNGDVETVTPDGGGVIGGVGDPEKMNEKELKQVAKDKFTSSIKIVGDVSDNSIEKMITVAQDDFIDKFRNVKVSNDLANGLNTIMGERKDGRAFVSGVQDSVGMGINENVSKETIAHELGHTIGAVYGYTFNYPSAISRKTSPGKLASNFDGEMPDFGGELKFGDTTVGFNDYMLADENGNIPKGGEANAERAVAQADRSEIAIKESTASSFDEKTEEFANLSTGDMIKYEDTRGNVQVGVVTNQYYGLGEDNYAKTVVHNMHTKRAGVTDNPAGPTGDIALNPKQEEMAGEVIGFVDKTETARNMGVDVDEGTSVEQCEGPEEVANLMGEVNKQWAKVAAHKEAGRDQIAKQLRIKNNYSTTNAHETLATAIETAMDTRGKISQKITQTNQELTEAIDNVVEVPESTRQAIQQ